uniref:Uncharacterized protein n=1 Tax=Rhizophora mucronata TaxID=61149 RepID=A0A2P2IYE2_RHIMU
MQEADANFQSLRFRPRQS